MTIEELRMLAKAGSIDGNENMFRKQLESIFTTLPTPKSTPKKVPKPKNVLL